MQIIDGKELSKKVLEEVKVKLQGEKFKFKSKPHLVVIQVGDDPASNVYIRNKKKACEDVGIKFDLLKHDENITTEDLQALITELIVFGETTSIIVQLPLPKYIDTDAIIREIPTFKDVDGFTIRQAGYLQLGMKDKNRLLPCTAKGIIRLLESVTDLEGKTAVVIGRSNIVGKPVAQLLQEKNANVILCHSKTSKEDIKKFISISDIVVSAIGKPKYFGEDYFTSINSNYKLNKIIIDAGINRDENNKLCGDIDTDSLNASNMCNSWLYTPVPGGVGPMTVAELIDNVYLSYEHQLSR